MTSFIISIGVVTLVSSILITILPENSNGNVVKFVLSLLIIFVILNPFISNEENFNYEFEILEETSISAQEEFLNYFIEEKVEYIKKNCNIICNEEGIIPTKIDVKYNNKNNQLLLNEITVYFIYKENLSNDNKIISVTKVKKNLESIYDTKIVMENASE